MDALEVEVVALLAETDGQLLTTEYLYSATGLAPEFYQSATLNRRGRISRQGLAEHRDALMGTAWGLAQTHRRSVNATPNYEPVAWHRSRQVSRWPVTHAGWHTDCSEPNDPSLNGVIVEEGSAANGDGHDSYAARRRNLDCRPLALDRSSRRTRKPAAHGD